MQHKNTIKNNRGCPALRDAVKKYGIDNFKFEILIFCFDEDRYKLEIEYIKKYNTQVPNGYNISKGGTGGGFEWKNHSEESKEKIKIKLKQKITSKLKLQISERNKIIMNTKEIRNKIKDGLKNSEKWNKAIKEKRVGNYKKKSPNKETKNKISKSLKEYYSQDNKTSLDARTEIMNKMKGIKIQQYDENNNLIKEFKSIREAARITKIPRTSIGSNLTNKVEHAGGFIWKKVKL
jgi:group I intron endonuclease